jgi:hypothetical protein
MVTHFHLENCENSLYLAIATIQTRQNRLKVTGTVGDGSAEAWFEAMVGEQIQVQVLPVWDADADALCQRYDQLQLETALADCLAELRFRCEGYFDPWSGCWQQRIMAEKSSCDLASFPYSALRVRPHQQVSESAPRWQKQQALI